MKKVIYLTALVTVLLSCKKETKDPTPTPTGSCYCGEILQMDMSNTSIAAKNNCSGNILYFDIAASEWINLSTGEQYCRPQAW